MLKALFPLCIAFTCFAQNANAGLVLGDGSAQAAYGQQNYAKTVGWLQTNDQTNGAMPRGSGVLVYKDDFTMMFLDTSHQNIMTPGDPSSRFDSYRFGFGNYFDDAGYAVDEVILHPLANGQINGYDYGIGVVRGDLSNLDVQTAILYNGTVMVGQDSDIAGYGNLIDIKNASSETFTGDLRAGSNVISNVAFLHPNYVTTRFEPDSLPNYRPLGMGGTSGDSGGDCLLMVSSLASMHLRR